MDPDGKRKNNIATRWNINIDRIASLKGGNYDEQKNVKKSYNN